MADPKAATLEARVLSTVRETPGLSDAEIAALLPGAACRHTQVNRRCRSLAVQGLIERSKADGEPIRNWPVSSAGPCLPYVKSTQKQNLAKATAAQSSSAVPLTELTVTFRWWSAGEFARDNGGRLLAPPLTAGPAIYKIRFMARKALYIGESKDVRRRMHVNYRAPGPSQTTSIRINAALVGALAKDEVCTLEVCDSVALQVDAVRLDADLTSSTMRRFVENAALIAERHTRWTILNRAD